MVRDESKPNLECSLVYPDIKITDANQLDIIDIPHLSAIRDWRPRWISYYFKQYYNNLLDVSCGNARNALYYRWKGLKVQCTEFDETLVVGCQNKGIPCKQVDLNKDSLPFQDNYFDVVTCTEVIEHLEEPVEAINEMIRVTLDKVFITTPHSHDYNTPEHLHFWNDLTFKSEIIDKIDADCTLCKLPTKPEDTLLKWRIFLLIIDKTEGESNE